MKKPKFAAVTKIVGIALILTAASTFGANYSAKQIANLFPGDANYDCVFFQLEGVSAADPAAPSPWFVIPRSRLNYREMYALLLSARLSGTPVNVGTTGNTACGGRAEVNWVELGPP
jgi:hypothetical protein